MLTSHRNNTRVKQYTVLSEQGWGYNIKIFLLVKVSLLPKRKFNLRIDIEYILTYSKNYAWVYQQHIFQIECVCRNCIK